MNAVVVVAVVVVRWWCCGWWRWWRSSLVAIGTSVGCRTRFFASSHLSLPSTNHMINKCKPLHHQVRRTHFPSHIWTCTHNLSWTLDIPFSSNSTHNPTTLLPPPHSTANGPHNSKPANHPVHTITNSGLRREVFFIYFTKWLLTFSVGNENNDDDDEWPPHIVIVTIIITWSATTRGGVAATTLHHHRHTNAKLGRIGGSRGMSYSFVLY